MKKHIPLFLTLAICISMICLYGCSSQDGVPSQDGYSLNNSAEWSYPGSEIYGISEEMSIALADEFEKANKAGKGEEYLKAIMGFSKVEKTENRDAEGNPIRILELPFGEEEIIHVKGKTESVNIVQPIYVNDDAKVFLNGKLASFTDIKAGYFISYWGENMHYQEELISPQAILDVDLIISLSPDYSIGG